MQFWSVRVPLVCVAAQSLQPRPDPLHATPEQVGVLLDSPIQACPVNQFYTLCSLGDEDQDAAHTRGVGFVGFAQWLAELAIEGRNDVLEDKPEAQGGGEAAEVVEEGGEEYGARGREAVFVSGTWSHVASRLIASSILGSDLTDIAAALDGGKGQVCHADSNWSSGDNNRSTSTTRFLDA